MHGLIHICITVNQHVVYDGVLSEARPVNCGVPQGSSLGPLLFLIYTNSLPNCAKHGAINMFADDTALFITGKDSVQIKQNLNTDLKLITQWLEDNGLVINQEFIKNIKSIYY
jgi:hypothetical protein